MILLDQKHAGELSVRAGCGLEGHLIHACYFTQILSRKRKHLLAALGAVRRGKRMDLGKAGQCGHLFVNAGVVFHRARAKRIEPAVDAVNPLTKLGIVARELRL